MRVDTDVDVDPGAGDVNFFFHQKMRNWYLGNYKKDGEKSLPFKQEARKSKSWVQVDPPYALKC